MNFKKNMLFTYLLGSHRHGRQVGDQAVALQPQSVCLGRGRRRFALALIEDGPGTGHPKVHVDNDLILAIPLFSSLCSFSLGVLKKCKEVLADGLNGSEAQAIDRLGALGDAPVGRGRFERLPDEFLTVARGDPMHAVTFHHGGGGSSKGAQSLSSGLGGPTWKQGETVSKAARLDGRRPNQAEASQDTLSAAATRLASNSFFVFLFADFLPLTASDQAYS